jgi:hypothetical protein
MAQRGPLSLIGCLGELINGESYGNEVNSNYFKYFMAIDCQAPQGPKGRGIKPTKLGGQSCNYLLLEDKKLEWTSSNWRHIYS